MCVFMLLLLILFVLMLKRFLLLTPIPYTYTCSGICAYVDVVQYCSC